MDLSLQNKWNCLEKWFSNQKGVLTAFSGGVDSALVTFLARRFLGKEKAIAVISTSESLKIRDYETAVNFAKQHDIILKIIKTPELYDSNYYLNSFNRCYFCKTYLYSEMEIVGKQYMGYALINGTNVDDYKDFRPGHAAAEDFRVLSPLAECKLTKKDIRQMAKDLGLTVWNKPASPCLSSRIPYGEKITRKKLIAIETAEEILFDNGFKEVRVRHYGDLCKIEVPVKELKRLNNLFDKINAMILKQTDFTQCVIDKEGFVSGKLNRLTVNSNE